VSLTVETDTGRVRGVRSVDRSEVRVFRGIPFAAPPVGEDRFGPPLPVRPWSEVFDAQAFGASPMQPTGGPFGAIIPGTDAGDVSEDCLTLNVWTPEGGPGDRPVMFWVYGGAYLSGGTSIDTYDAARLSAEHDVVVVSANYRVGVFGFLWPGVEAGVRANTGLLDQLAALEWIQRNISAFGGDPQCVTVFGESAGAGSLLHLLSSPLSRGLFRRMICQSPGVDHTIDAARAARARAAFLTELGIDDDGASLDRLRQVPASELVEAQTRCLPSLMGAISSMPFHPVIDGTLLAEKPSASISEGAGSDVDLLLTWTADEMRLFPNRRADVAGRDGLVRWTDRYLDSRLGRPAPTGRAASLVDFYLESESARGRTRPAYAWAALQTDGIMRLPARRIAEYRLAQPGATFCAQFSWPSRGKGWERGAFHAADLPFVFGTFDRCGWAEFLGADDHAEALSAEMRAAWTSFARTGMPTGPNTGAWPRYDAADRSTMILDTPVSAVNDPLGEIDTLWADLWSIDGGPPPGLG
jgi:para-nitrobenzyl esterase